MFALQDAVALAVAGKIEPTVELAEIRQAAARPTDNINSHDLYLRALPVFRTHTKDGTLGALDLLNQAIALDADHGPALALAVSCHRTLIVYGWSDDAEDHRRQGILLARRALKAAPDDATVLASIANDLTVLERSLDVAFPLAKRAVAMNPDSASVWFNSGYVQLTAGETEIAIRHFENAMRFDPAGPNRPIHLMFLAFANFFAERFGEAIALVRERNQYSESPGGYALLAASHGHLGQTGPAQEALARYRFLTPLPIETLVQVFIDPAQRKLVLDGIALAEAKSPADSPSGD
jgi:predicted Zn-dependent protease